MFTKPCTNCKIVKYADDFYRRPANNDNLDYRCKTCRMEDAKKYYANNQEKRLAQIKEYFKTERGKEIASRKNKKMREKFRYKQQARIALNAAVARGKIIKPEVCENCGDNYKLEAHHEDYSKHLEVIWLCVICHHDKHGVLLPINRRLANA